MDWELFDRAETIDEGTERGERRGSRRIDVNRTVSKPRDAKLHKGTNHGRKISLFTRFLCLSHSLSVSVCLYIPPSQIHIFPSLFVSLSLVSIFGNS